MYAALNNMMELPMNLKFNGLVLVASGRDILELTAATLEFEIQWTCVSGIWKGYFRVNCCHLSKNCNDVCMQH